MVKYSNFVHKLQGLHKTFVAQPIPLLGNYNLNFQ